jgi:hypothetical protein
MQIKLYEKSSIFLVCDGGVEVEVKSFACHAFLLRILQTPQLLPHNNHNTYNYKTW